LYHGTGSVDPNVVHGLPPEQVVVPVTTFVEKTSKTSKNLKKEEKAKQEPHQPHPHGEEKVDAMKEKKKPWHMQNPEMIKLQM